MLSSLIDRFQAKFPPNRLAALALALLVPTVITPAAAFLAVWIPAHFPGLPIFTAAQLAGFGITGAAAALLAGCTAAYKFIDGCQKDERNKSIAASVGANHAHAEHLKAMELESLERRAAIVSASSPEYALELLGMPVLLDNSPGSAVGANVPASPPPVEVPQPEASNHPLGGPDVAVEPNGDLVHGAAPPVPLPPRAAAELARDGEPID